MLLLVAGFGVGIILGSLVKALSHRSLLNKSFFGRSECIHCQHKLNWFDLIPIFSYLLLLGRCRYCKKKISQEYLVVEIIMGFLIAYLFWTSSLFNLEGLFDLIFKTFFITILSVLFLTDIKDMFIPDRIVIPSILITLGLLIIAVVLGFKTPQMLIQSILLGLVIGGFFLSLIIITKGRGMGGGDVKLGALMGLSLGFPDSILATMLAFLLGATIAIFLLIFGRKRFGEVIPFGPFLVLGSLMALFWGREIINYYLLIGT